jgi:hypothetical protein
MSSKEYPTDHRIPASRFVLLLPVLLLAAPVVRAQQRDPHIGYIYPAGARSGATVEVTIGGQYLTGVTNVVLSGSGVRASSFKYVKPLRQNERNELNQKLRERQKKLQQQAKKKGAKDGGWGGPGLGKVPHDPRGINIEKLTLKGIAELRKLLNDPKKQPNAQIAELVILRLKLAANTPPGPRELRLRTRAGLSNPMPFHVGQLPELMEQEPNNRTAGKNVAKALPATLNGQIMPGDVDRFRFEARKGQKLTIATRARELVPYLADAVPGWFQAVVALYDADGKEVAFTDDFRFNPDPALLYTVPKDGAYELEIRDSIYRGREDFVYRIDVGQLPYVTSIYPLGGQVGKSATVEVSGWNLASRRVTLETRGRQPGIHTMRVRRSTRFSNPLTYALDTLPERAEAEPNDDPKGAQPIKSSSVVNGRVMRPGDWDLYRIEGRAGLAIVAEVHARRLGSPLDSVLRLTDSKGQTIAVNDDHVDKGAGLTTHHADSLLYAKLKTSGRYYLHVGDAQNKGGPAYAYRLRISPPRTEFALRVVPSAINARPGTTVALTVHALRDVGFSGDIALKLKDAPTGFELSGARVPEGEDAVRLTLTLPKRLPKEAVSLCLEGIASRGGRQIRRSAVAAEDMMQAFLYRHLVPAADLMVAALPSKWAPPPVRIASRSPAKIPVGGSVRVEYRSENKSHGKNFKFELSDPPEGVTIREATPVPGGVDVVLQAAGETAKPGAKGNLIVEVLNQWRNKGKDGKPKGPAKRNRVGLLPATPYEIVQR